MLSGINEEVAVNSFERQQVIDINTTVKVSFNTFNSQCDKSKRNTFRM